MNKFIMLIGLPASGKSSYAKKFSENAVVLSSDAIRKELYGDETIQDNPAIIFDLMFKRTREALNSGKDVIYDATNIKRKNRVHLLKQLPKCQKIAVVLWAKYEDCVERDAKRVKKVGKGVITRMLREFQPPYYDEGWDEINVIHTGNLYTNKDYDCWLDCDHDNPHHPNTVQEHTIRVVKEVEVAYGDGSDDLSFILIMAASFHDVGKKFVKSFTNSRGETTEIAHYYSHHNVSSYFALGSEGLNWNEKANALTKDEMLQVVWLINAHMEPFFDSKYYKSLSEDLKNLVDAFHSCDIKGA